jgi:RNA polymerase sigma-70 factor (ECF subfamily)
LDRTKAIAREIPHLRRYARALLRDFDEADDLVQDCIERAIARLHQWRDRDSPRQWLFTIMHNLYVDEIRKRQRRTSGPALTVIDGDQLASEPRQLTHLETKDVLAALHALPDERRAALVLVGVEGFNYRDAAAVLGVPVGTLMSRLARGREQLRAVLGDDARPAANIRSLKT